MLCKKKRIKEKIIKKCLEKLMKKKKKLETRNAAREETFSNANSV